MEDTVIRGYRYTGFKTCRSTANVHETVKLKMLFLDCVQIRKVV